jgi:UrcA family protein
METRRNLCRLALLAGAALLSTGALATPIDEPTITEAEVVKYSVSEAATPVGAMALYRKLRAASLRVCSANVPATNIRFVDRDCAADALEKAVADVGNPVLIALHLDMQGGGRAAGVEPAGPKGMETIASR